MKKILLASIVAFVGLAFAAPNVMAAPKGKAKINKKQKVKEYDFSGDDIDGEQIRPEGENIIGFHNASQSSLIRIRLDFIKEILKSAEDI